MNKIIKKLAIYGLNLVIVTTHIFLGIGQAYAAPIGVAYQYFENDKAVSWDIDEPNAVVTDSDNPAGVKKYDCRIYGTANEAIRVQAFIHGLIDSGIDVIEGLGDGIEMAGPVAAVLLSGAVQVGVAGGQVPPILMDALEVGLNQIGYNSMRQYFYAIVEEYKKMDVDVLVDQIESTTNQTMSQIDGFFNELDADLRACPARQSYVGGRVLGVALETVLPAGAAVKVLTKVKLINKIKNLSYLTVLNHFDDANLNKILNKNNAFLRKIVDDEDFRIFLSNSRDADRYEHIFYGDAGGGWHYRWTGEGVNGNEILEITRRNPNTGAYDARVMINGRETNKTFFPDNWDEEEVIRAINEGFENKRYNEEFDEWEATIRGIKIRYNLDANGKIRSAFPNQRTNF